MVQMSPPVLRPLRVGWALTLPNLGMKSVKLLFHLLKNLLLYGVGFAGK